MKFYIPLKAILACFCPRLWKSAYTVSVLMLSMIIWLLLVMPLAAAGIPGPDLPPDWLIEQSFRKGKLDVHDMQLRRGSIYITASHFTVDGMDVLDGNVFVGDYGVEKQGIHLRQDISTAQGALRYVVYRNSELIRKSDNSTVHFDGVVFSRKGVTYSDLNYLLNYPSSQQQAYRLRSPDSDELVKLPEVNQRYRNLVYLRKLGYTAYLTLPVEQLYRQALAGDAKAQFIYGMYWQGLSWLDGAGDEINKQLSLFTRAASSGNQDAALMAGAIYLEIGPIETALPYLETAAVAGIPMAQYKLAVVLVNGGLVTKDEKRAFRLFRDAASQGFALAQFEYGLMLFQGTGTVANRQEGLRYMILSALSGNQRVATILQEAGCGEIVPALLAEGCAIESGVFD